MARHASLDITDEQEANLRKLAAYLMTLPEDYPDFEMRDFVQASDGEAKEFAHLPVCGTAACAVGHGPNAGIAPHDRETWRAYSERLSGFNFYDDDEWDWCFSGGEPQPRYPFQFIQADALKLDESFLSGFHAIHASPPCQRYSDLAKRNGNASAHPDLVEPVRMLLHFIGRPYVIENVEGAPLIDPVVLCGTMFSPLRVLRHRLFETDWPLTQPAHGKHPLVYTMDKRKGHFGRLDQETAFVQVTGGGNCSKAAAAAAMGIDWMTKDELNQAIPPAYTRFIGEQLIAYLQRRIAA